MADVKSRKALLREYRERTETGGVYAIRNNATGRVLIQSTMTIEKAASIIAFSKATGSCVHPLVADDWKAYGPDAFSLEILETLDRKETQDTAAFREDIRALEDLWREKLSGTPLY
jgi:hypothetical protein